MNFNQYTALYFLLFVLYYFLTQNARAETIQPKPVVATPALVPNEVVHVDLLWRNNLERHHTIKYQTNTRASLVLRRSETISFKVYLNRPFNRTLDKLRLELSFNSATHPTTTLDDNSLIYVPILNTSYQQKVITTPVITNGTIANSTTTSIELTEVPLNALKYEARIKSVEANGKQLHVEANLAPSMAVGIWRMRISTKLAAEFDQSAIRPGIIYTYVVRELIYILFNAWSPYDDVYLPRDDARNEYLLNEIGKIYIGSYSSPVGRRWTYGQFDESVLPVLMHLLDRSKLSTTERSSPVRISRAISGLINSNDDNGLLAGNWSGNYGDGLAPWQWNGSPPIFKRYILNGYQTVRHGQCWVFGGLTTSSLRALGIPARSISNFVSAHDTDSSLTVDKFYSNWGSEMRDVNSDSIWNFHVWTDAWMQRPDLPDGYGGWQAIDATPQEKSMGLFQLGPASLEAIKQGKVGYAYDVAFVFSEVNANVVYWHLDGRTQLQWRKTRIQAGHTGRKILTKMIGVIDDRSRAQVLDAEDIVGQYKYPDGSRESQRAFAEAATGAGLQPLFENRR